jgi:hypothetical protein
MSNKLFSKKGLTEIIPLWADLRPIGKSSISKATILMPFIGYIILFDGQFIYHTAISQWIEVSEDRFWNVPSLRTIYCFYFGLLIFSISNAIYLLVCPKTIKISSDRYEFSQREWNIVSRHSAQNLLATLRVRYGYSPSRTFDDGENAVERINNLRNANGRDLWLSRNGDLLHEIIDVFYQKENESTHYIRCIISIGYLVSFLILATPSTLTLFQILGNYFH